MSYQRRIYRFGNVFAILLVIACLCFADATPGYAVTVVVNTTNDDDNVEDSYCSLREAISAIKNLDGDYYGCIGGDVSSVITLPDGIYTVNSQLSTNTTILIDGANSEETIIQASDCDPTYDTCTNDHQLFWVYGPGDLTLNSLTLRYAKNIDNGNGGAILNGGVLTISNCILSANRGFNGGVIQNLGGTTTITDSTFLGNVADYRAGVINNDGTLIIINSTFSGNKSQDDDGFGDGGVIYNSTTGSLSIEKSTFSGNEGRFGGAISSYGAIEMTNSTFSGNTASIRGGSIYNNNTLTITNCTFSENASGFGGAAVENSPAGTLNYSNTIIADSLIGEEGFECNNQGTIVTNIGNLVEDGSCDSVYSGDPTLGPLADNGGLTQTHALQTESIAIDNGNLAACPDTDQRGVSRPQGEGCDIGAYEWEPFKFSFLPLILR
ncbi:MAG TPA: choice-of-anchor Q domain-containing protein [Brevefilum sp.]